MRGSIPIDLPVPVSGWRTDQPPQKLSPDALRDGRNLLLGVDGVLAPRPGYARLPAQPPLGVADPRIMAGIGFTDTNGIEQVVIATLTQWFALNGDDWLDITGPVLGGDKNTPTRLVQFGSFNAQAAVYGVNGWQHNKLRLWLVNTTTHLVGTQEVANQPAVEVVNGYFNSIVHPTAPAPVGPTSFTASDLDVVADRLAVIDTSETGGGNGGHRRPDVVRWSKVLDGTWWPDLAWNPLAGIGNLVAIRATSRTAAVVYGQNGAYIMSGVQGDDAGAFVFDRIEGVTVGPLSPSALISVGGVHYYLGNDYHIYRCDGQNVDQICGPIHAAIMPKSPWSSRLAMPPAQKPVAMYDKIEQRIWFFVAFAGDEEAHHALVLNLPITGIRSGSWQVPQELFEGITSAFPVLEQFAPTWDEPGIHGSTTLTAPVGATDTTIPVVSTAGFPLTLLAPGHGRRTGVVSIPDYDAENAIGEFIVYTGLMATTLVGCTRGAFGTSAAAYAAATTVMSEITWNDADLVWPNWNAIPDSQEPALYLGTDTGFVCRLGGASMDPDNTLIKYQAQWGLIAAQATQELQINTVDLLLDLIPGDDLLMEVRLFSTVQVQPMPPYKLPFRQIVNQILLGADPDTWNFRVDAQVVADDAFQPGNYMDVQLSGSSAMGGARYAGGTLYADVRQRPDRLPGVPGLDKGPTTQ